MDKLYIAILDNRERDSARLSALFQFLSVVNGVLLGFGIAREQNRATKIVICIVGGAMCLLWFLMSRRMVAWIVWWEKKAIELEGAGFPAFFSAPASTRTEAQSGTEPKPADSASSSPAGLGAFRLFQNRSIDQSASISTRLGAQALPLIFLLGWAALGVQYFWYPPASKASEIAIANPVEMRMTKPTEVALTTPVNVTCVSATSPSPLWRVPTP